MRNRQKIRELSRSASDFHDSSVVRDLFVEESSQQACASLLHQRPRRIDIVVVREWRLLVKRLDQIGDVTACELVEICRYEQPGNSLFHRVRVPRFLVSSETSADC